MRLAVLAAMLGACRGASYCDRLAKQAKDCGAPVSDEEVTECDDALAVCDDDDDKLIDDYVECLDDNAFFDKSSSLNLVYTWDTKGHGTEVSGPCATTRP